MWMFGRYNFCHVHQLSHLLINTKWYGIIINFVLLDKSKILPYGARGKVRGSLNSIDFILWGA